MLTCSTFAEAPVDRMSREAVDYVEHIGSAGFKGFAIDGLTVYCHPFLYAIQMRRGVAAGLEAGGPQAALDHRRHRALSVRAADVNRSIRALRVAERRQNGADVVEPELDAELFECEQPFERATD